MAVAAFKGDGKFHVGVDDQVLGDRVVLEGRDGHGDGVDATDVGATHDERLGRVVGILAVDAHVLHIVHVRLLVLRLYAEGRGDVDVVDHFLVEAQHLKRRHGALRDGHHTAVGWQVGLAGFAGDGEDVDAHLAHLFTTVLDRIKRDLAHVVADVQPVTGLLRQVEALLPLDGIVEGLCQGGAADEGKQHQGNGDG
ncbi:MAG: hypothetical protein F083_2768 [bacterium F083]|nr:MAG: hypothetical protein F083_2768 [bacterium F083]